MNGHVFKILFVCTGNICRSPTADAVMRHKIKVAGLDHLISVDSAGTHGYHIGKVPDARSMETAMRLGQIDMSVLRARKVQAGDFHDFDWLIAMDEGHHSILDRMNTGGVRGSVHRFMAFLDQPEADVPDPYYGGQEGFDDVYTMIDQGCARILEEIRQKACL